MRCLPSPYALPSLPSPPVHSTPININTPVLILMEVELTGGEGSGEEANIMDTKQPAAQREL